MNSPANQGTFHQAVANLFQTYCKVRHRLNGIVKQYDLTGQQYNVLKILQTQYPSAVKVGFIRLHMLEEMSDSSRIISRLHKKEMVIFTPNTRDRRVSDVRISEKGMRIMGVIDREFRIEDLIKTGLNEGQAKQLNILLEGIVTGKQASGLPGKSSGDF